MVVVKVAVLNVTCREKPCILFPRDLFLMLLSVCLPAASGGWQEPENPHTQRVGFIQMNKSSVGYCGDTL